VLDLPSSICELCFKCKEWLIVVPVTICIVQVVVSSQIYLA